MRPQASRHVQLMLAGLHTACRLWAGSPLRWAVCFGIPSVRCTPSHAACPLQRGAVGRAPVCPVRHMGSNVHIENANPPTEACNCFEISPIRCAPSHGASPLRKGAAGSVRTSLLGKPHRRPLASPLRAHTDSEAPRPLTRPAA